MREEQSVMSRNMKYNILTSKFFLGFLYRLVRFYSATFRLIVENEDQWLDYLKNGGRVLLCGWHQQFSPAIRYFSKYRPYRPSLMISRSADGEIIAGVAKRTGWHTIRGSSSKGGHEALHEMIRKLKETGLAAHILDGPKGPAGVVKPGAIRIASDADAVIVPFYASADRAWYFNSWDRFMLPKPFARVILRFGKPIRCPRFDTKESFEGQRRLLQDTMRPMLVTSEG